MGYFGEMILANTIVVCIFLFIMLTVGEPDILDGLIAWVHGWSK